jgi:PilZ domain
LKNRRSLTPSDPETGAQNGADGVDLHATRRGGARHEVSARVTLASSSPARTLEGWALNMSRGGIRLILEEKVEPGAEFDVTLDDGSGAAARTGRIVWVQDEPDGVICGIEFRFDSDAPKR